VRVHLHVGVGVWVRACGCASVCVCAWSCACACVYLRVYKGVYVCTGVMRELTRQSRVYVCLGELCV